MRMLPSGKLVFIGCWSGLGLLLHYYSFGVYGDFLEARNYFRCASFLISAPRCWLRNFSDSINSAMLFTGRAKP